MAIVRFVFAALKPGVDPTAYEKFEREVDYAVSANIENNRELPHPPHHRDGH